MSARRQPIFAPQQPGLPQLSAPIRSAKPRWSRSLQWLTAVLVLSSAVLASEMPAPHATPEELGLRLPDAPPLPGNDRRVVLGAESLAIIVGSWGRDRQTFNRAHAGQLSSLLVLSTIGLLLPALFDYAMNGQTTTSGRLIRDEHLSLAVSVVLILVYAGNLIYTMVTHRDVFAFVEGEGDAHPSESHGAWPIWKALTVLAAATIVTAYEAEMISGALESTSAALGLSEFFLGIILLARRRSAVST